MTRKLQTLTECFEQAGKKFPFEVIFYNPDCSEKENGLVVTITGRYKNQNNNCNKFRYNTTYSLDYFYDDADFEYKPLQFDKDIALLLD